MIGILQHDLHKVESCYSYSRVTCSICATQLDSLSGLRRGDAVAVCELGKVQYVLSGLRKQVELSAF